MTNVFIESPDLGVQKGSKDRFIQKLKNRNSPISAFSRIDAPAITVKTPSSQEDDLIERRNTVGDLPKESQIATPPSQIRNDQKPNSLKYDRKEKVPKTGYTDHGAHGLVTPSSYNDNSPSIVKKMTLSLSQLYQGNKFQETQQLAKTNLYSSPHETGDTDSKPGKKRVSPEQNGNVHSSNNGLSLLSQNINKNKFNNTTSQGDQARKLAAPSGLLHAALQGSSSQVDQNTEVPTSRGECLTNPSEPDPSNDKDNSEGNLIIYKNDLISVPSHALRMHKSKIDASIFVKNDNTGNSTSFQVLGLLGQGTFAQVFKCRNVATGHLVAVKIVKNKPAYTRQAAMEIEIFQALAKDIPQDFLHETESTNNLHKTGNKNMVELLCYFMHQSHLCLVFELHGLNLFEVLKRRQFRGLPIDSVRNVVKQGLEGVNELSQRNIVHCDLKPENILMGSDKAVYEMIHSGEGQNSGSASSSQKKEGDYEQTLLGKLQQDAEKKIKLIDFGSACFEGQATHTYIQSRFYRSPEVLIGLDYDAAIDLWSLGCVAAELFLGLPILPGAHEHDQLHRISEMIGKLPDWMIDQGTKCSKYFTKKVNDEGSSLRNHSIPLTTSKLHWELKTREEFVNDLSDEEKSQYGGISKLEQQPANRYFKRKLLEDIVMLHGGCSCRDEKEELGLFIHFLKGILNPDPCERWTAFQASTHPFVTGNKPPVRRINLDDKVDCEDKKSLEQLVWNIHWKKPFDPSICRRKLALTRRKSSRRRSSDLLEQRGLRQIPQHLASPITSRVTDLTGAMSISHSYFDSDNQSPPLALNDGSGSTLRSPHTLGAGPYSAKNTSSSSLSGLHYHHSLCDNSNRPNHPSLSSSHSQFNSTKTLSNHGHMNDNVQEQLLVAPALPITMGAQSFSGVYYDRMHNVPMEGELGYALQRPGVVPEGGKMTQAGPYHLQPSHLGQVPFPPPPAPFMGRPSSYSQSDMHQLPPNGSSMPQMVAYHGSMPFSPPNMPRDNGSLNSLPLDLPPHFPQNGGQMYGNYPNFQGSQNSQRRSRNHRGSM